MKITPEMIDAMGGQNSIGYNQFQKLCSKAYNCLRRHSNIFVALLSMLSKLSPEIDNGKFTEQFIDSQVIKRFIPGELYTEASLQYKTQIINNYNTSTLIDYCYYHKKETHNSPAIEFDKNISKNNGIKIDGKINFRHCIKSTSATYHGDQWVKGEVIVLGGESITHIIENDTVLNIDDLIATGGTAEAAAKIVEISNGSVAGFIFVINLFDLPGNDLLKKKGYYTESLVEFPGH